MNFTTYQVLASTRQTWPSLLSSTPLMVKQIRAPALIKKMHHIYQYTNRNTRLLNFSTTNPKVYIFFLQLGCLRLGFCHQRHLQFLLGFCHEGFGHMNASNWDDTVCDLQYVSCSMLRRVLCTLDLHSIVVRTVKREPIGFLVRYTLTAMVLISAQ